MGIGARSATLLLFASKHEVVFNACARALAYALRFFYRSESVLLLAGVSTRPLTRPPEQEPTAIGVWVRFQAARFGLLRFGGFEF